VTSTQVITYQYDNANRMTNAGGVAYTWDNNGNLLNDGSASYLYDRANRLISTTVNSTTSLFNYNGDSVRLKQVVAGVVTTYTQDLAAPLPVVLQSKTGVTTTPYLYSLGTRPVAQYTSGNAEYLLPDALGSVRQIVDANGNVTLAKSYEPYGSVLTSTGTASSIFGYAGEEVDTSGLIYLRARYMQPRLGIFFSRDPWSGDQMRPVSMNGFGYTEGNPVNATDASGMLPFFITAYVQNSSALGGLALRNIPDQTALDIKRMPDGTRMNVWIGPKIVGNTSFVYGSDSSNTWGWAVAWQNETQYLKNVSPPPPPPPPDPGGSGGLTHLPVESPVYDNGYGTYPTWTYPFHDGYDIHSGTGNKTVYSMGGGTVDDINSTSWMGIRILMDAGFYIRYVHVRAGTDICVGTRVEGGRVLGEYDLIGRTDYYHVHVGFERNWNDPLNPASYWPGGAPEEFTGAWGNPQ
jgi:RHS repeat-associated protein